MEIFRYFVPTGRPGLEMGIGREATSPRHVSPLPLFAVLRCSRRARGCPPPPSSFHRPSLRAPPMGLLSNVFGSSMLFQSGAPIPLWGAAPPGALIRVSASGGANATATATADSRGFWRAELPARPASPSPFSILITSSAGANATLSDVVVGALFVCGGQSNLSGATTPLKYLFNATESAAEAALMPFVRIFAVGEQAVVGLLPPQAQLGFAPVQPWVRANSTNVATFSGACWMAAKAAAQRLGPNQPLGFIESAWSGTCIQGWLPSDALASCGSVPKAQGWQTNSTLFNQLVAPFANVVVGGGGLQVSGFIYYQGESNAIFWEPGYYACGLAALLSSWRAAFSSPMAWWGVVQVAPWSGFNTVAAAAADVRAAELAVTRGDAHSTLATAIDLGDIDAPLSSIHPRASHTPPTSQPLEKR